MKRSTLFGAAVTLGLAMVAGPAVAQMNSIPVYHNPKGGSGLLVAADFGKGVNNESGKNTAFAFRTALGVGPFSFGGSIGVANPVVGLDRETKVQYMGNMGLRLLGGGLIPVSLSLQTGVGILNITSDTPGADYKILNVPVGLGLGFSVPSPTFNFEPWIAPRVTFVRNTSNSLTANQVSVGFSAGLDFSFIGGFGIHVAGDWQKNPLEIVTAGTGTLTVPETKPFVFGIGLNYRISIPGLPGVPMVPGV